MATNVYVFICTVYISSIYISNYINKYGKQFCSYYHNFQYIISVILAHPLSAGYRPVPFI